MAEDNASPGTRVSFTFTGTLVACSLPVSIPVKAFQQRNNADGSTTIDLEFEAHAKLVTTAYLEALVEQNYDRIRDLVHRSHKSSAKAINTVTQRYTNRAVKAVYKRESSFTESEPSDLEISIPASPAKRKKRPFSHDGVVKRAKTEVAEDA
ncbi:hypothetical protein AURDEDRAFT_163078 [Auricularia subglabra TFB-10046 SS5]|nr:hypothetical protein AURDEDRAFT_163078 [Auricularia subglabra TFB-10046 SS5]